MYGNTVGLSDDCTNELHGSSIVHWLTKPPTTRVVTLDLAGLLHCAAMVIDGNKAGDHPALFTTKQHAAAKSPTANCLVIDTASNLDEWQTILVDAAKVLAVGMRFARCMLNYPIVSLDIVDLGSHTNPKPDTARYALRLTLRPESFDTVLQTAFIAQMIGPVLDIPALIPVAFLPEELRK